MNKSSKSWPRKIINTNDRIVITFHMKILFILSAFFIFIAFYIIGEFFFLL